MSIPAAGVVKLALDYVFGGVRPTGHASHHEVDQPRLDDQIHALHRCFTVDESFDPCLMVRHLGSGMLAESDRLRALEFMAVLTRSLKESPFFMTGSLVDDADRKATDRDFYVTAKVAAIMTGKTENALYIKHHRRRIVGGSWVSYTSGGRLFIPIAYVDKVRDEQKAKMLAERKKSEKSAEGVALELKVS